MNKQTLNIRHVAAINVAANLGLTIIKLIAGIFGNSSALISDAAHSGADILSATVTFFGVKLAQKGPDSNHNYGHESYEGIASLFLAIILLGAGLMIGANGLREIISGNYINAPNSLAVTVAIISAVIKEIMCIFTRRAATVSGSLPLKAEAWHLRTDVFASAGCLIGVIGARFGLYVLDSVAALIVSILVLKVAVTILIDSIRKITDRSCENEVIQVMCRQIMDQPGVIDISELKTRICGSAICVDAVISADGNQSLAEASEIGERIHMALRENNPKMTHCNVCVTASKH